MHIPYDTVTLHFPPSFFSFIIPALTYQCQTWSLTKDLERKLVTCEMECLRKAVNKTRRDKIRNEVIRDMVGAKQQQIKWFGHITRMPINQSVLQAYNTKYSGWRARGRPRKRWSDSVADTLRTEGMSLLQATRLAADRQLCPLATPTGTSGRKKVQVSIIPLIFPVILVHRVKLYACCCGYVSLLLRRVAYPCLKARKARWLRNTEIRAMKRKQ